MSKIRPIIFSTPMVRAILDGRKTQTRRVIKINGCPITSPKESLELTKEGLIYHSFCSMSGYYKLLCQPGDILWVRETWSKDENGEYVYRANYGTTEDDSFPPSMFKWKPSIHMPCEAARIFLRVTNVRVERLQEIGGQGHHDDLFKEGAYQIGDSTGREMLQRFAELWNSTIEKKDLDTCGWEANPWVWVYEFERVKESEVGEDGKTRI
jgi:hypothetical protein